MPKIGIEAFFDSKRFNWSKCILKGYVTTMPKTGNEKYFISRGFNWSKMPFERLRDFPSKTGNKTVFDSKGFKLTHLVFSQADDTKSSRFYITGFNIDLQFVENMVISKANNTGKFNINSMHAALNKEAYSAEIFIEIDGTIRVRTLAAQLEDMGACQVSILTFQHNDGNESASNALVRVWTSAVKTGCGYERGTVSKDLWGKANAKFEAEKQQQADNAKNEAKFTEGVRQSLADIGGKVDTVEGKINNVQHGMCTIIPDYQKLLKETMEKLAHKTKEVDRIENKMGRMTHEINRITEENENLKEASNMASRKHEREITELKYTLETKDKQIKDKDELLENYRTFETAKWIIETERELKRARA